MCSKVDKSAWLQVATEGDAFTMAFHDPIDAIAWALEVQHKLLTLPWPDQLLTQPDAGLVYSPDVTHAELVLFKGLRVRMAIHTGRPEAVQVRNLRTNGYDGLLYWATTSSKTT